MAAERKKNAKTNKRKKNTDLITHCHFHRDSKFDTSIDLSRSESCKLITGGLLDKPKGIEGKHWLMLRLHFHQTKQNKKKIQNHIFTLRRDRGERKTSIDSTVEHFLTDNWDRERQCWKITVADSFLAKRSVIFFVKFLLAVLPWGKIIFCDELNQWRVTFPI